MVLGFFLVRPVPLPHAEYSHVSDHAIDDEDGDFSASSPSYRRDNSRTHLLSSEAGSEPFRDDAALDVSLERRHVDLPSDYVVPTDDALALNPSGLTNSRHRPRSSLGSSHRLPSSNKGVGGPLNIRGSALAYSKMFWLLFVITLLRTSPSS